VPEILCEPINRISGPQVLLDGSKPRSTETHRQRGEIVISAWRLTPAVPLRDLSGNQGVTDQRVNGGDRAGSGWTVVVRPVMR